MDVWRSEELIKEFYRALKKRGFPEQGASRHRERLRFFLHAYLAEEWPRDLDRVEPQMIRDFLGSWFIEQIGGSKVDILNYLKTFRLFYEFLFHNAGLSPAEYQELLAAIQDQQFFMERYEEYLKSLREDPESFFHFLETGRAVPPRAPGKRGVGVRAFGRFESAMDRHLWMLVKNLDRGDTPALFDFALFLDYLATKRIRLKARSLAYPDYHLQRMNKCFTRPEKLNSRHESPPLRIVWFHELAQALKLIHISPESRKVQVLGRLDSFLDLSPESRLALMIDASWNKIPWSRLGDPREEKVSSWAWNHRSGFAALLENLAPGMECILDPDPAADHREEALLTRYILFHPVVEEAVLFALREMGLLSYKRRREGAGERGEVKAITITRLGRQVMRYFARKARKENQDQPDPVARLQEVLLIS